ncbi:MAG: AzlD domain-containing protein [Eubacteriales bacterium]|jgi:branched-subunit amino acid transport protein
MDLTYMLCGIAAVSGTTYLIRCLPIAIIRRKFKNRFFLSLLKYLPFGVLAAMIFPAVFTCCGSVLVSVIGCAAALIIAFIKPNLLLVAFGAVGAAWLSDFIIRLLSA